MKDTHEVPDQTSSDNSPPNKSILQITVENMNANAQKEGENPVPEEGEKRSLYLFRLADQCKSDLRRYLVLKGDVFRVDIESKIMEIDRLRKQIENYQSFGELAMSPDDHEGEIKALEGFLKHERNIKDLENFLNNEGIKTIDNYRLIYLRTITIDEIKSQSGYEKRHEAEKNYLRQLFGQIENYQEDYKANNQNYFFNKQDKSKETLALGALKSIEATYYKKEAESSDAGESHSSSGDLEQLQRFKNSETELKKYWKEFDAQLRDLYLGAEDH